MRRGATVSADDVVRDYAPLAEDYETRWQAFNAVSRQWVLARWPALPCGARVLDAGCGAGGFLAALGRRDAPPTLVGLDLSPALLAQAQRAAPAALLVRGNAESPPFAAASFDVVCSLNVLHHLNEPAAHLAALAALCRPRGSLFVVTFAAAHGLAMRFADAWLRRVNPAWRGAPTIAQMRQMLAAEQRLMPAEAAVLRAGFWWLQLYRLKIRD